MRFVAGRGADKVCCWQGRCGEAVAGRDPSAQRTAGRDAAVAEMLPARGAAVAEILLAGGAVEESGKRARQQAPARQAICRKGCTIGKTLQAGALQ